MQIRTPVHRECARSKHRGMFPNSAARMREEEREEERKGGEEEGKKKERKIFRDRLLFRSGVSASVKENAARMRRTKPREARKRQGEKLEIIRLYLARRWFKCFRGSLRGWNWIRGKICFIINARVYLRKCSDRDSGAFPVTRDLPRFLSASRYPA